MSDSHFKVWMNAVSVYKVWAYFCVYLASYAWCAMFDISSAEGVQVAICHFIPSSADNSHYIYRKKKLFYIWYDLYVGVSPCN